MEYKHYWNKPKKISKKDWTNFAELARDIINSGKVPICDDINSVFEAEISYNLIKFNGVDSDTHGTFYFTRTADEYEIKGNLAFNFCSTARKPYDIYVTAILILAKFCFQDKINISSDGSITDWLSGFYLVKSVIPDIIMIQDYPNAVDKMRFEVKQAIVIEEKEVELSPEQQKKFDEIQNLIG